MNQLRYFPSINIYIAAATFIVAIVTPTHAKTGIALDLPRLRICQAGLCIASQYVAPKLASQGRLAAPQAVRQRVGNRIAKGTVLTNPAFAMTYGQTEGATEVSVHGKLVHPANEAPFVDDWCVVLHNQTFAVRTGTIVTPHTGDWEFSLTSGDVRFRAPVDLGFQKYDAQLDSTQLGQLKQHINFSAVPIEISELKKLVENILEEN